MSTVGRDGEHVLVILTEAEAGLVHDLIVEYLWLIGGQDGPPPARFFPAASRDDAGIAAAFSAERHDELLARKIENAELVSTSADLEPPLLLAAPSVERWLSTFTDLRIMLADRMEIRSDDDPIPDTDTGLVYRWLGMMQELMIHHLEEPS